MVWSRQPDHTARADGSASGWPDDAVAAWDWVQHPDWDIQALQGGSLGVSQWNDLALVFLDEAISTPHAYLISESESDQLEEGAAVVVVGWGQQIATGQWETPPDGSYGIKQIGTSYIAELGDWEFQVGAVVDDVRKCHGDSGGPSFLTVDALSEDKMRLVGVTSHAYDQSDCDQTGGVDTRVDPYLEWIDAEMRSRCEDGTRAWCDTDGLVTPPVPLEEEEEQEDERLGCACSSTSTPSSWLIGLAALVLFRRR